MHVSSVAQMREMDRRAIEEYGIPELLLMENAAMAMLRLLRDKLGVEAKRFLLLCGTGNNGGDGMALARLLASYDARVTVLLVGSPDRLRGSTRQNYEMLAMLGIAVTQVAEGINLQAAAEKYDVVIDALLGTGISRPVTGLLADLIGQMNAGAAPILSVDIPSGIDGDTGAVMGVAVQATWTVIFGTPKIGNLLYPGYAYGGALATSPISFPTALYKGAELRVQLNMPVKIAPRVVAGHKGTFGDALFVAGAGSYYGAPFLSAYAMIKAGGGYSRLATPRSLAPTLAQLAPELIFMAQTETATGSMAFSNLDALVAHAKRGDIVVVGPGLSLDDEAQALARGLVARVERPLLIDGDGITAIHKELALVRGRSSPTILTPHMGEMARITGRPAHEIERDKISMLRKTTADLGAVIVLKGAHTLIGYPNGDVYINLSGNSGMATPGSGDVLTGTIAAMVGLGLEIDEAVRMGVFIHGVAGDLAADQIGEDGVTASDILHHLPVAMARLRAGHYLGNQDPYTVRIV